MEDGYARLIYEAFGSEDFEAIDKSMFLEDREKRVILEYYRDLKSLKDIAEELGVARQCISQIKKRAMDGVRSTLYESHISSEKKKEYITPIYDFEDLSVRSRNALMRNGLRTPEAIGKYIVSQNLGPEEALMQIRNIGRGTAKEINCFLKNRNLRMPV